MPLSIHRPRKLAVCTFDVPEWLAPSLFLHNSRRHFTQTSTAHGVVRKYPVRPGKRSTKLREYLSNVVKYSPDRRHRAIEYNLNRLSKHANPNSPDDPSQYPPPSPRPHTKYSVFEKLVLEQLYFVLAGLKWHTPLGRFTLKGWGIESHEHFMLKTREFKGEISRAFERAENNGRINEDDNRLYYRLRTAFITKDIPGLCTEIQHSLLNFIVDIEIPPSELANQQRFADLRYPTEWYPATRAMQRTIHLHVGPTNSGKTYQALQRLEAANTGIYAGPLRLLAHEVYTRFNAKGKPCALVTGEERRYPEDLNVVMNSCTVEMVPLNTKVDVAVIDEIQMMSDNFRGWAWTQAFLGVQAKEVHLCGELRTIPLIQQLCATMGEKLEIHRYERLSPLKTSGKHIGSLDNLRKGDAVIVFSRLGIHAMKAEIEKATQRRCAVVYGSLPPETRAQQANLFNDPDNDYDFLVASDAVGMGLNLAIGRVIFESTSKRTGAGSLQVLEPSDIKQIGGRAGRYKTARDAVTEAVNDGVPSVESAENSPLQLVLPSANKTPQKTGYVTTLEKFDLELVTKAMEAEVEPLKQACILPPSSVVNRFASYFPPGTPFSWIILRLNELALTSPGFKLCGLKDQIDVADIIQTCNLSHSDRFIFMASPAAVRDLGMAEVVKEFAECVANHTGGELLGMKSLNFEILDIDMDNYAGHMDYLREVESLHRALTLYLWLSYRFTGVFRSQALAFHAKSLVEEKIDECLNAVHWDSSKRLEKAKLRAESMAQQLKLESERSRLGEESSIENEGEVEMEHGEENLPTEEDEAEGSVSFDDEESGLEEMDDSEELELQADLSDDGNTDAMADVAETAASEQNDQEASELPDDEAARVVERGPLLEGVSQKNHDSTSP